MVIQHNLTAMNSNRMLGLTQGSQAKSTEKLSSGYKINRAADDAAGLSISEKMRKQIRGLTQASLNAEDGISAVQTAEGALNEVQDMLQRMNELAVKSANSTNSESDREAIQAEIDQLVTEIDRVSETTKFNETYLLRGDKNATKGTDFAYKDAAVLNQDLYYLEDGKAVTVKAGTLIAGMDSDKTYYSDKSNVTAGTQLTTTNSGTYLDTKTIVSSSNLYVKGDDGNFYAVESSAEKVTGETYYTAATVSNTAGAINSTFASVSVTGGSTTVVKDEVTVYDSTGKQLDEGTVVDPTKLSNYYYEKSEVGTSVNYTTLSENASVQFVDKDGNEIAANGLERYLDADGNLIAGSGLCIRTAEGITGIKDANQAYVDAMVVATDKYDVGALSLKLHVGADATSTNQITLDIEAMSADRLGIDGLKVDGVDDTNALNAIETIKEALNKVSDQRSALGAVQNRLEHTIANLDNVVENTTAAESQIRDTDMATEMVKYSNNNILAQAGQAMLAQANQANQGVLSILG